MKKLNNLYRKFILISACTGISLILPIRVLYMISFNISDGSIGILRAIFSVTVTLFELPTGIIADKVSRKVSILFSSFFFIVHGIFYLLMPNFLGFMLTQISLGLSASFSSGATSAYLHDYIEKETDDNFMEIYGKISMYTQMIAVVMTLSSATLFSIDNRLNFIFVVIIGFIGFLLTLTLPTDSVSKEKGDRITGYVKHIKFSISNMLSDKYLMMIVIFTAINMSLLIFNFDYYQIMLRDSLFPSKLMGILYASFMLLGGIGAKVSNRIVQKLGPENTMRLYASLIVISYIIFGITMNIFVILFGIIIQQVCFGSWNLIIQKVVLDKAPSSDLKSTMASINSLILNLSKAILVIILSFIMTKTNYKFTYLVMGLIITLLISYEWITTKNKSKITTQLGDEINEYSGF